MAFGLVLPSSEILGPCLKGSGHKNEKSLLSTPFVRLGNSSKQKHIQVLNRDDVSVGAYRPSMHGFVEEAGVGEKFCNQETSAKSKIVRTLLIDNYDSYTYNVYQELSVINGVPPVVVHNDEWTWEQIHQFLYKEKAFDNIVISPGPGSPTCPADIGICSRILLECKDIPILGVCLGHQALGYVHGAKIVHAPEPVHGRLSEIEHVGCDLFHDIPSGTNSGFNVVRYHSLAIDADSLPTEVIPIAWSCTAGTLSFLENQKSGVAEVFKCQSEKSIALVAMNMKHKYSWYSKIFNGTESTKVIMGIRHATRPHYGVQFHPESVATNYGRKIFQNFRKITVDYWSRSSQVHERKAHSTAWMQVPLKSQPFIRMPTSKLIENNIDGLNCLDLCKPAMLSHERFDAKFLKLEWRKLDCLARQVGGAKNIFCELFGDQKSENTFWLDSSSTEQRRARFSYMGGKGGSLWKQVTFKLSNQRDMPMEAGGYLTIEDADGDVTSRYLEDGFLNFLEKELQSFRYEEEDYKGLPFDFYGGYVGYIGYGLKVECGMVSNRHKSRTPDACFFFADNLVVIDHRYDDVYILSIHGIHHPQKAPRMHERSTTRSWLDDTEHKLLSLKGSTSKKFEEKMPQLAASSREVEFHVEKSRDQYMRDVGKCLKFIKDGESYELCLTTQMRKRLANVDYLGLYMKLRGANPAPYAAWLNFSKENLCICCSSPERFLQLDKTGMLEAKPIKGTIARGSTYEEDDQLKRQLQHSEKDQAENLMIVDLLRNDLGRVCEPGSVHVPRLMEVESYATVHTLVSTIQGKKRPELSPIDCVKAAFPGGSMTGAPKLRSMELLDSIESCSRGIYSGSIGFFSYNQTFDLNIVIRTIVIHEGEASIGAGGAIVALSKPEQEYEEMILKTKAPVKTVGEFERKSI